MTLHSTPKYINGRQQLTCVSHAEGAVLGSMKAVRALADAVVNEAVRVAQQRRDRLPLSDQVRPSARPLSPSLPITLMY